jgi:hypothetical protein
MSAEKKTFKEQCEAGAAFAELPNVRQPCHCNPGPEDPRRKCCQVPGSPGRGPGAPCNCTMESRGGKEPIRPCTDECGCRAAAGVCLNPLNNGQL